MSDGTLKRSYGKVFNEIAVEYDRNRPPPRLNAEDAIARPQGRGSLGLAGCSSG